MGAPAMNTEPRLRVVDYLQRGALHVDRLAEVRLPGADLASRDCWALPYFAQSSLVASTPMVLVAGPPTMVARTVTFSAPCLRARSQFVLSCFCTSSHWTPGCGWIATYVTM